ncbi:NADP-dependent glyceraldehyde-3-phosphate dehydrogenase [Dissulfurimicrobium hydrothermale]|uniref:NADP-dependent glyceraldehyde-3-phosphate dehydrogenase n=1 Tax=Dissulfurimicrobium hydrothermale TaxID=1750598 RepID=UPI001EDBCAD6|nr:NADP-dependent glyceraldehyde-3-phosphate dehydrogenase [Dissulfurimicrobium hydrothermale]UKL14240.1 NADP-dependent glyceraldehyde-3-phosphate dehydrogenase [Dissulfurimicrobium hydrothermale]
MKTQTDIDSIFPTQADIPERHRLDVPIEQRTYLIYGEMRRWNGPVEDVYSPVCIKNGWNMQQVRLGSYPLMEESDALQALDAALRAYENGRGHWPTMTVAERISHVQTFASRIKKRRDEVTRLLMWETGKSLAGSEQEFDRTIEYITNTIDALKDLDRVSSRFVIEQGIIAQIRRAPLGVVLCMGPYNYPLNETFATLIPALIMGNTVILKPPRYGVLLFSPLLEDFRESFPPGVINTIYGKGRSIAPPLLHTGKIDALAFIGTSKAANALYKEHPKPHRLRLALGLEAKNPAIVLPDADMDLAVRECISGSLSFNGQRCTALKIIFVQKDIVDEFLGRFLNVLGGMKRGMPWEDDVFITPLPEKGKIEYLTELIDDAEAFGARVLNHGGGKTVKTFFEPAVVYPVTKKMRLYTEEQFGPIVPVVPFDDISEPIGYMEASRYGQQVSIFGSNPEELAGLIDPLANQVCRVNINSQCQRGPDTFPFAGRKDSAVGTLSVSDALRTFSIRTLVAAKAEELNKNIISEIVRKRLSGFLSTDFIL